MEQRLRSVCDLRIAAVREEAGRHEYDGVVQDLGDTAVAAALGRLGYGESRSDPGREAHLRAFEEGLRTRFGELRMHRRDPTLHLINLDIACYDRPYAPAEERHTARRKHLAQWPEAAEVAVRTLDRVPAAVAAAALPGARALVRSVPDGLVESDPARAAAQRLADHLEACARTGDPSFALGPTDLQALLGAGEGDRPDLGSLTGTATRERARLLEQLHEACAVLAPGRPVTEVMAGLRADHPTTAAELAAEATAMVRELTGFCRGRGLVPYLDGECLIGPPPPARVWGLAMLAWSAPDEPDAPSWYWLTEPDPAWDPADVAAWRAVFCRTTLPAITAHEVFPGHLAHARALRRVHGDERRLLHSPTFIEGWAHYAEEMLVDQGFRATDPRFRIGVHLEALLRITRLTVAIGLHTGTMSLAEATELFRRHAFLDGVAARSEAERGLIEPTYGRYAWGKLAIRALVRQARRSRGPAFDLGGLHRDLLALGSPPIGQLDVALRTL